MKYHVAEDKSRKADIAIVDRAAKATTFNRSEMRLANFSDKVDVVNQKLANFCTAQPTTKFEYENIRAEKRDVKNGGRAYMIQQSAIYTTSQSNRFAAGKTFERGIKPDSLWRDPGKMYRSERNCGAIEFAARGDDLDVASHYRCYTSPRHCYRLPLQRTKQPLMGLFISNKYIGMPTRALVGFAPRNTKPPIKEPNASEKREKKDKKKDKEKKKPVIRTDGKSVDSSENQAKMVAKDNPKNDPDAMFRYEKGMKLAKEQPAAKAANDNDKFAEKGQQYVMKQLWKMNLKQSKPDIASPATASLERNTEKLRIASSNFKSGDTTTEVKTDAVPTPPSPNDLTKKSSSLKGTTADYLSTPSRQIDSSNNIAVRQDSDDTSLYMNSKELRKIIRTSPNMLKETIIDEEYNVPEGADLDIEIKAWRNLVARSVPIKENYLSNEENLENSVFIRPEAPQPKLDVRIVRSTEDLKDKEQPDSEYTSSKSIEIKQVGSPQKSDGFFTGKKLHTMSTQIRYEHTNKITQRHIGSLLSNFDKTMQTKYPGFTSAFSTKPEGSMQKKMIDEALKNEQQMESKSQNEKKSNDSDSNNIPNNNRSLLSQRFSNSDQEQADTNLAKTLNKITDKEMEISINQLQNTGHKKVSQLSNFSSEFMQKNQSRYKDEEAQEETERFEESHIKYLHNKDVSGIGFNNQSTNSESVKSTKEDSSDNSATSDSNVKDASNDSSKKGTNSDFVRLSDPYPYNKENLEKWRMPFIKNSIYKPWKREMSRSSNSSTVQSTLRNNPNAYANAAGEPRNSHVDDAVMEISGSDGDGGARKRMGQTNRFHVSSRDQRVVSDCLRGDAANVLGLQQWMEAFSQFYVDEKMDETARSDDNAPFHTHK